MEAPFQIPGAVVFLDKMWQEVFQNCSGDLCGVKLRQNENWAGKLLTNEICSSFGLKNPNPQFPPSRGFDGQSCYCRLLSLLPLSTSIPCKIPFSMGGTPRSIHRG